MFFFLFPVRVDVVVVDDDDDDDDDDFVTVVNIDVIDNCFLIFLFVIIDILFLLNLDHDMVLDPFVLLVLAVSYGLPNFQHI